MQATYLQLICSQCGCTFQRKKNAIRPTNVNHYCGKDCEREARKKRMRMLAKANNYQGINSSRAILTEYDVIKIRQDYASGMTVQSICDYTGMSENAIRSVVKYKTWKNVK